MPEEIRLSMTVDRLQKIAKNKDGDSFLTGKEFIEEYSRVNTNPLDEPPNSDLSFCGGAVHDAYSKTYSTYKQIRNKVNAETTEVDVSTLRINQTIIEEGLKFSVEQLEKAIETIDTILSQYNELVYTDKLSDLKIQLQNERDTLNKQINYIQEDSIVKL